MTTTTAKPSRTERTERSAVIHTNLDRAAAAINDLHARILSDVIEAKVWNIHRAGARRRRRPPTRPTLEFAPR